MQRRVSGVAMFALWNECGGVGAVPSDFTQSRATLLKAHERERPPPLPFGFVLAREENDLASQYGTVLRGSGKLYFCPV